MIKAARVLLMMLALYSMAVGQQPISEQVRKAVADLEVEIQALKAETASLKQREVQRNATSVQRAERRVVQRQWALKAAIKKESAVKALVNVKTERAIIEQESATPLATINEKRVDISLMTTENQKLVTALVTERATLKEKIRRQNNRRICRWFGIGCIGRK